MKGIVGFAVLVGCVGVLQAAAKPVPIRPREVWVVEHVSVDQKDQPAWNFRPDDPAMMSRIVRVREDGAVRFSGGDEPWCEAPRWTRRPDTTLGEQLGRTMPRSATARRPTRPSLADYAVRLADQRITPYDLTCRPRAANEPVNHLWPGAWLARPAPDRLLIGIQAAALLELRRVDERHPVLPTFNCAQATFPSERQICQSPELAGQDRSIALAYRWRASVSTPEALATLGREQVRWIQQRDSCAGSAQCLQDTLSQRVLELRNE